METPISKTWKLSPPYLAPFDSIRTSVLVDEPVVLTVLCVCFPVPPLPTVQQPPASRSPPGRSVPPPSSAGGAGPETSPDRASTETPSETQRMDTSEPAASRSPADPQRAEETSPRQSPQPHSQPHSQSEPAPQSGKAPLVRPVPQMPPLRPDSPPGGAGAGGEQRPLWPPSAERAPLPLTSPAIQATP